jgi:hypothetical protein
MAPMFNLPQAIVTDQVARPELTIALKKGNRKHSEHNDSLYSAKRLPSFHLMMGHIAEHHVCPYPHHRSEPPASVCPCPEGEEGRYYKLPNAEKIGNTYAASLHSPNCRIWLLPRFNGSPAEKPLPSNGKKILYLPKLLRVKH